ncbi:unnamed protein product [Leptosia nina]|uniref:Uncharacterized protein n=1 Tax=Leptosia nina TaxID=320188 RepID=A0AAV1J2F9_9NEOP
MSGSLQNAVSSSITKIDCTTDDLSQILFLDEARLRCRSGEVPSTSSSSSRNSRPQPSDHLTVIQEENEDDYPFDF